MQQITFKTYSILVTSIYNGYFVLNILYFLSIGIGYTIKRERKVFKYIQKRKKKKKTKKGETGKFST
uniref:Uncharacterized protein n=1 Tax=Anguilla anguilla TaxID=7936 RepID=A0A0E9WS16_ANGAN